jgi:flagellar motor switch protein FliN/FliY
LNLFAVMTDPNSSDKASSPPPRGAPQPFSSAGIDPGSLGPLRGADSLAFVMDVPVELTIELGRKQVKIGDVLRLGPGSVLELEKANGEPLDVYVNNRLVARGEAVVLGERYGIRLIEVLVGDENGASKP